jgi:hypothetical protein
LHGRVNLKLKLVFNTDALYRAHNKKLKHMPFDRELYEEQLQNPEKAFAIGEDKKDLLQSTIQEQ